MTNLLSKKPKSPMEKAAKLMELQILYKQMKEQIDGYKADLLAVTQELDVLTLKTGDYTISRAKRITPQVADFKRLKKSLDDADIPYMTQEVFADQMTEVFKIAIKEGRELDGLEVKETEYISIRINK